MSLYQQLQERELNQKPIRIGLIGAGKFGAMYLAQIPRTPGVHLVAIADLSPEAARTNLRRVGWDIARTQANSIEAAIQEGTCFITDDWTKLVNSDQIDVIVECTGNPIAAVEHCLKAFAQGKHVVNVTVEADAFCGPLLAKKAKEANVIYSLAFGEGSALLGGLAKAWMRGVELVAVDVAVGDHHQQHQPVQRDGELRIAIGGAKRVHETILTQ